MTSFRENRPSRTEIARRLRAPLDEAPATVPFVATLAAMATESTKEAAMAPRRGLGLRLAAVAASVVVVTAGASYASGHLGGGPEPIAPVSGDTQLDDDANEDEFEVEVEPMVTEVQVEIKNNPKPEFDAKRRDNDEGVEEVDDEEDVDPWTHDTAPSVDTNSVDTGTEVSDVTTADTPDTATQEDADTGDTGADAETDAETDAAGDDD